MVVSEKRMKGRSGRWMDIIKQYIDMGGDYRAKRNKTAWIFYTYACQPPSVRWRYLRSCDSLVQASSRD